MVPPAKKLPQCYRDFTKGPEICPNPPDFVLNHMNLVKYDIIWDLTPRRRGDGCGGGGRFQPMEK